MPKFFVSIEVALAVEATSADEAAMIGERWAAAHLCNLPQPPGSFATYMVEPLPDGVREFSEPSLGACDVKP